MLVSPSVGHTVTTRQVYAPAVECAEDNAQLNGLDDRSSFWLPWELPRRVEADVRRVASALCTVHKQWSHPRLMGAHEAAARA